VIELSYQVKEVSSLNEDYNQTLLGESNKEVISSI
jgi:hypothetical protein